MQKSFSLLQWILKKKKNMYQIKYILRLSCVKTLACKHKSTARAFLKRVDSEDPEPKIVAFASNNIIEAVNQYKLIRNLIQIQYNTCGT